MFIDRLTCLNLDGTTHWEGDFATVLFMLPLSISRKEILIFPLWKGLVIPLSQVSKWHEIILSLFNIWKKAWGITTSVIIIQDLSQLVNMRT